jgi:hypothetical protein
MLRVIWKYLQFCDNRWTSEEQALNLAGTGQADQTPKSLESRIVRDLKFTFAVNEDKFFVLEGLE